jgi:trehalose utilization protein
MSNIKVAIITGGHPFDVQPFHRLFRSMPGIEAYIQHTDEFASGLLAVRDRYDVLVFYSMFRDTPRDDGPWYAGKPKSALERLGETSQGVVILHHALLAYPNWALWDEIVGISERIMRSYHPNERIQVDIADPQHPIVKGVTTWEMIDETYLMPEAESENHTILTTQHPRCVKTVGWTRQYKQARVFCFQSGHGDATYADPNFQAILANGIRWAARG